MKKSGISIIIGLVVVAGLFVSSQLFVHSASAEGTRGYTVTSPTSSSVWQAGTTQEITWTWTLTAGTNVMIEYDWWFYSTPTTIAASTPNDGSYMWSIPAGIQPRDNYFIRISNVSDSSDYDDSEFFSIIASGQGSITVTSPTILSVWQAGTSRTITWTSQGDVGNNVRITLDWLIYSDPTTISSSTPNDGSYEWTIPESTPPRTTYFVRITSISHSSIYGESDFFQITSPPTNILVFAMLGIIILVIIIVVIVVAVMAMKKKKATAPPPPGMPPGQTQQYPPQQQAYQQQPVKMCPKCGSSNAGNATFCLKCGNKI